MPKLFSRQGMVYLLLAVLLVATVALIVVQVAGANTATRTESALFNVIQFALSLAFAWILARLVTEKQFVDSQRKFAIGAFRRIREIERSLLRTRKYVDETFTSRRKIAVSDLAVIRTGLTNTSDTVKSSIADWADIIGSEIELSNEITRLKRLTSEDFGGEGGHDEAAPTAKEIKKKISQLAQELPAELRAEIEGEELDKVEIGRMFLETLWEESKAIELEAFWERDDSFSRDLSPIRLGQNVSIARGFTEHRRDALFLYDSDQEWIAVVTNLCLDVGCNYPDFVHALEDFYGRPLLPRVFKGNPLSAVVTEIREMDKEGGRQYVVVKVSEKPD